MDNDFIIKEYISFYASRRGHIPTIEQVENFKEKDIYSIKYFLEEERLSMKDAFEEYIKQSNN